MANPRAEKKGAQRKRKRSEGVPLSRWIPISAPKVIPQVFSSTFTISDCPGILLVGDVMIGRLVNQHLKSAKPEYPWGDTLPLFRATMFEYAISNACFPTVVALTETLVHTRSRSRFC